MIWKGCGRAAPCPPGLVKRLSRVAHTPGPPVAVFVDSLSSNGPTGNPHPRFRVGLIRALTVQSEWSAVTWFSQNSQNMRFHVASSKVMVISTTVEYGLSLHV